MSERPTKIVAKAMQDRVAELMSAHEDAFFQAMKEAKELHGECGTGRFKFPCTISVSVEPKSNSADLVVKMTWAKKESYERKSTVDWEPMLPEPPGGWCPSDRPLIDVTSSDTESILDRGKRLLGGIQGDQPVDAEEADQSADEEVDEPHADAD